MVSINIQMATQSPSAFGMPACGHAFETTLRHTMTDGTTTSVVRDRQVTLVSAVSTASAVKGDTGIALAYFPGTPAWRPPIC